MNSAMNAKLNSSGAGGSVSHVPVSARPRPLGLSSVARWLVLSKCGESGWLRNEFPLIPTYSRLFPDSQEKRGVGKNSRRRGRSNPVKPSQTNKTGKGLKNVVSAKRTHLGDQKGEKWEMSQHNIQRHRSQCSQKF
jgi:hypothetical protein